MNACTELDCGISAAVAANSTSVSLLNPTITPVASSTRGTTRSRSTRRVGVGRVPARHALQARIEPDCTGRWR
jgi:hypothetical protein